MRQYPLIKLNREPGSKPILSFTVFQPPDRLRHDKTNDGNSYSRTDQTPNKIVTFNPIPVLNAIARVGLVFTMAIASSAALADITVYRNPKEWKETASSLGTQLETIDFFSKEKDDITGDHLKSRTYRKVSISGVTFETVSSPNSAFAINPYADPYAGVLFDDADSTLRITFGQSVKSVALLGAPIGLGTPSIRISGQTAPYEFGPGTGFVGFVSDKMPIEWIEFTARKRYDLDKVFYYRSP